MSPNKEFDKSELRERLTPTQYQVTQEHHTEKSVDTLMLSRAAYMSLVTRFSARAFNAYYLHKSTNLQKLTNNFSAPNSPGIAHKT